MTGQPVALPSHRHTKYKASNITEAASTHRPLHRVHITYVHYICTLHKYITHVHPRMYISTVPICTFLYVHSHMYIPIPIYVHMYIPIYICRYITYILQLHVCTHLKIQQQMYIHTCTYRRYNTHTWVFTQICTHTRGTIPIHGY